MRITHRIGFSVILCTALLFQIVPPVFAAPSLSAGTTQEFDGDDPQSNDIVQLSDTTYLIAYRDLSAGNDGVARVVTISGDTITIGSKTTFDASLALSIQATRLSDSKVIITYSTTDNDTKFVIGQVSGTSISFGTPSTLDGDADRAPAVAVHSSNSITLFYADYSDSNIGKAAKATISGTVASVGSAVDFSSNGASLRDAVALSSTHSAVLYADDDNNNGGRLVIVDSSGGTPTVGSPSTLTTDSILNADLLLVDSDTVMMAYRDLGGSNNGVTRIADISGTTITLGSAQEFDSDTVQDMELAALNSSTVMLAYFDTGSSGAGTAIVGTISGTTFTEADTLVFSATSTSQIGLADVSSTRALVTYNDSSNNGQIRFLTYAESVSGNSNNNPGGGAAHRARRQRYAEIAAGSGGTLNSAEKPSLKEVGIFTPQVVHTAASDDVVEDNSAEEEVEEVTTEEDTINDSPAPEKQESTYESVMHERVCLRVDRRFAGNNKMLERINDRLMRRFGWSC